MSFPSNTHNTSRHGDEPTTITVSPSPADILRDAAAYLQRHGWIQGRYYAESPSPHPPACALGAIGIIAHRGEILDQPINNLGGCLDAVNALETYLDRDDVPTWNDHPHRTTDQVITALHQAATYHEHLRI